VKRILSLSALAALAASVLFLACPAQRGDIKVGVILPLTGPQAITGLKIKNGYELAADEINAAGGVKSLGGAKLKLIFGDTEGKPDVGVSEVQRLIEKEKVVAIMGCFQSNVAMATVPVAERLNTPYVVGNPMADAITEQGFKYAVRITAKSSWMARDQMQFIKDIGDRTGKKASTVALLYEDTDFGQSSAKGQREFAAQYGYKVVADVTYPNQTSDITPAILKLRKANPDVIIATSYDADAALIMRTMKELGYKPTCAFIGSTGGYINPSFISAAGPLSENVYTINLWNYDLKKPGARQYYEKYKAKYGQDPVPQDAIANAAVYVLKDALERTRSVDKAKLRDALRSTDIAGGPTDILPYDRIHFDSTGQNMDVSLVMVQIQHGQFVTVWPFPVAQGEAVWPVK
jgi:branched-chain amino acid transport system substrate-binding protein